MIDSAQLHILRHSLGIDGLMSAGHFINEGASRCRYYHVTDAGKAVVAEHKPPEPVLTRSQKRYRDWLKADLGITFSEYLRCRNIDRGETH